MVTAEYQVKTQSNQKSEFNSLSFAVLINKINKDPDLLRMDWRNLVRSTFRLSPNQEWSLVNVTEDRVHEIQNELTDFAEQIEQGATIQGKIILRPNEEQTPDAVHVVQIELRWPNRTSRMLRIAHCDADCRNWRWG